MDCGVRNSLILLACLASVAFGAPPGAPPATTAAASLRTADGKPDLEGYWSNGSVTPLESA